MLKSVSTMKVNICTVVILLTVVTSSLAARSVEQVLDRQLNKKGYAVLELKKKRLVLRDIKDDDSKHNNHHRNARHHKDSREYDRSGIPADMALKSKVVHHKTLNKLANSNIEYAQQRQRRHNKRDNSDHLGRAQIDDIAAVHASLAAEANDLAAAVETEEFIQESDKNSGTATSNSMTSHEEHSSNEEDNMNQSEIENAHTNVGNDNYDPGDYHTEEESSEEMKTNDQDSGGGNDYTMAKAAEETYTDNAGEHETTKAKVHKEHLTDSTKELAMQIGTVFDILAKREKYLIERMDQLRASLAESVQTIQSAENELILKRKRRDDEVNNVIVEAMQALSKKDLNRLLARAKRNDPHPQNACVYIDVPVMPLPHIEIEHQPYASFSEDNYAHTTFTGSGNSVSSSVAHTAEEFNSNEYSHSADYNHDQSGAMQTGQQTEFQENKQPNNFELTSDDVTHEKYQSSISHMGPNNEKQNHQESYESNEHSLGKTIDLNSVYWLKLPVEYNDSTDQKVFDLLTSVSHAGRDILIIPVSKGYSTKEDITNGFLRAVHIAPAAKRAKYLKQVKRDRIQKHLLQ